MSEKKNIVIVGGGIIGSTSAYYLTRHPRFNPATTTITLLEATRIAGGASGKAGGLLALWAYPSSIVPLSFRLHKELAVEHGGVERWGYRGVGCGSIEARGNSLRTPSINGAKDRPTDEKDGISANGSGLGDHVSLKKRSKEARGMLKAKGVPGDLDWIDEDCIRSYEEMSEPGHTAQVHPYLFTKAMVELAEEKGVRVEYGSATSINTSKDGKEVESVSYRAKEDGSPHILPATHVVLSAGPWTKQIWPKAPITATRAHSITIRPSRPVSPYTLFTSITLPKEFYKSSPTPTRKLAKHGTTVTPEIYARPNNEVYACGDGDSTIPLPTTTELVQVDPQRCQDVVDYVCSISEELRYGEVTARQACYLPGVQGSDSPIIGEGSVKGLVWAVGHTCWGIQNSTATGCLVGEIVMEGKASSAEMGGLDPKRVGL
ncbi:fad dependent oxidoreductase [Venturia nashicola]|uniref:Fad dependent oxidoreductase n=1 Tax=Venturia nashicola TaxID=86259 RepID=A0A4Z1NVD2_9PEZI|nr:fad dependent oxidoreductase [Venturia nashicola]TLD31729.1 fad dependent oxidoreductase [Venturia nashicola]